MFSLSLSDEVRFWSKVSKAPHPQGCWIWMAGKSNNKYGVFDLSGKSISAHRLSYQLKNGVIPQGLFVCHRCDNPSCVNPDHLFVGTPKDNTRDCVAKGRIVRGDRAGSRLHPERMSRGDNHYLRRNPEKVTGENNPCARLTANQVREIRQMFSGERMAYGDTAKKYGVTPEHISAIVHRRVWKHIE